MSKEKIIKAKKVVAQKEEIKTPETTVEEKKEIQVIEKIIESKEIAPQDIFGKLQRSQIDLIKRTVAKGATDDELQLFLQVCKGANLNPFMKQVFLVFRWDSKEGKNVGAIQVSIDGFRAIAEESGAYAGNEDPEFVGNETISLESKKEIHHPESAKVTVYKMVQGQRFAFVATARWDEYYPGPKMGFQWHQRPYLMLGKCAEALALRKAFPKLLSGMYAPEELERGAEEKKPEEDTAKMLEKIKTQISQFTLEEIKSFRIKMKASPKYTAEQKDQMFEIADRREVELMQNDGKI